MFCSFKFPVCVVCPLLPAGFQALHRVAWAWHEQSIKYTEVPTFNKKILIGDAILEEERKRAYVGKQDAFIIYLTDI